MSRYCFCFARTEEAKYLSHLDLLRLFQRALRRSALPLAYSEGYNPHPRFSLAAPLPVGVTSEREYGELVLKERRAPSGVQEALASQLPPGLLLKKVVTIDMEQPSMASIVNAAAYLAQWAAVRPLLQGMIRNAVDQLLAREQLPVERIKKNRTSIVDVRPYLFRMAVLDRPGAGPCLDMLLQTGSSGGVSPNIILKKLLEQPAVKLEGKQGYDWLIHRRGLFIYKDGTLTDPFPEGGEQTEEKDYS